MTELLLPLLPLVASAAQPSDVAATIIAMERAALDQSDRFDADGFWELSDPGVVYVDPALEQPIVGLENLREYHKSFGGGSTPASGEMLNSNVQVMGDTAVMTFNYQRKDGKEPRSGGQRPTTGTGVLWNLTAGGTEEPEQHGSKNA